MNSSITPKKIRLLPNSMRLKQLIHEHGSVWNVLKAVNMPIFNGELAYEIESHDGKHTRNVRTTDTTRL